MEKLKQATERLEKSGIEDAAREAETILIHCLRTDRSAFYRDNAIIPESVLERIDEFLDRRSKKEPLQYILGYVDFCGMKMRVGKGVLIPRPETELLAEEIIKTVKRVVLSVSLNILDLCTGSGCLALAMAKEFPDAQVYGTDVSEIAIRYAKENAEINSIKNVTFLKGSLFEPITELLIFDLIISNPPYIKRDDIRNLQPEIKDWEPLEALEGGEDGLDYYRLIIPESRGYLKDSGCLMLELGISQADAIRELAVKAGFKDIYFKKDYAGIERILVAKLLVKL